jgi:hypothetical protein
MGVHYGRNVVRLPAWGPVSLVAIWREGYRNSKHASAHISISAWTIGHRGISNSRLLRHKAKSSDMVSDVDRADFK